ncbi:MAG: hypothetical protein PHS30_10200, partial [Bacteroidales bacterium]|nr:hypothetical protein [Bacteroidales bacterium]
MKQFFISVFALFLCFNSYAAKTLVSIDAKGKSEVYQFAQQELKKFLSDHYDLTTGSAAWQIVLQENSTLSEGAFSIEYRDTNKKQQIILSGS